MAIIFNLIFWGLRAKFSLVKYKTKCSKTNGFFQLSNPLKLCLKSILFLHFCFWLFWSRKEGKIIDAKEFSIQNTCEDRKRYLHSKKDLPNPVKIKTCKSKGS